MLKNVFLIFFVLMLVGCQTATTRPSPEQENQYQTPAYPLTKQSDIKSIQQGLKSRGFNPGPVDGFMGNKTSIAIRQFQQKEGYPVDGLATTKLLEQLEPGYASPKKASYNDEIVGESTAVSAGVGALIGAVIGASVGDKDTALKGAAIGALAGAATDVAVNTYRVDKAKSEHQLNISIDQLRQQNAELKRKINDAKNIIKEDKTKIQHIKKQLQQKTLSKQQAQKEYSQLDQNRQLLQTTYDDLLTKQKEWQKYADAPGATKEVNDEINRLNQEVASLRTQLDELDQLRSISITG